jgi:hypothetical protein
MGGAINMEEHDQFYYQACAIIGDLRVARDIANQVLQDLRELKSEMLAEAQKEQEDQIAYDQEAA